MSTEVTENTPAETPDHSDEVLYEVRGHAAWITINRPHRRNAMARRTVQQLTEAFVEAGEDPDVYAVVITGTGDKAFCAGGDMKEMDDLARSGRQIHVPMTGTYRALFEVMLETYKPVIAALNGHAIAGGCEIALSADVRIGVEGATIGLTEARRGMGANLGSVLLPRLLPRAVAMDLLYTARTIPMAEAKEIGPGQPGRPARILRCGGAEVRRRDPRELAGHAAPLQGDGDQELGPAAAQRPAPERRPQPVPERGPRRGRPRLPGEARPRMEEPLATPDPAAGAPAAVVPGTAAAGAPSPPTRPTELHPPNPHQPNPQQEKPMSFLDPALWSGKVHTGAWTAGAAGTLAVRESATGDVLGEIGVASGDQARAAAATAAAAQRGWAALKPAERAAVLRRAAALFEEHAAEIEEWIVRESGGTRTKARTEIAAAVAECHEAAALPSHPHGEVLTSNKDRWSIARRRPAGVVTVIAPFNFPLTLSIRSVAPALGLGNAVLLKPDPRTSVSGGVVLQRVFDAAGLPAGVLQTLPGGADVGEAVVAAPEVRIISFTGSTPAGRRVGEAAARHLKRAHLELGGNNAIVVLPGADVQRAASAGRVWLLPAPGPDLHGDRPPPGPRVPLRRLRGRAGREGRRAARRRPVPRGRPAGPDHRRAPARRIDGIVQDTVLPAPRWPPAVPTTGCSTGLPCSPSSGAGMRAWEEEIFGPVAPVLRLHAPWRRPPSWSTQRVRPLRRDPG